MSVGAKSKSMFAEVRDLVAILLIGFILAAIAVSL